MRRKRSTTYFEHRNFVSINMLKADEISGRVLFEEKQKYPRWVIGLIVVCLLLAVAGVLLSVFTGAEKNDVRIALPIVILVSAITIYLIAKSRLETAVTSNGFYFRGKPLQSKYRVIEKEEISTIEARNFPFLSRGYGWFPSYGWYYIAATGEGVQLHLKNGKKFFFSSALRPSFERALENLISSKS